MAKVPGKQANPIIRGLLWSIAAVAAIAHVCEIICDLIRQMRRKK